ncbi:hypothetical protein B0T16DRAFT_490262 [Cercophora newfieldiana]|uniref:Uncharacterized protein n=1 Tax=Cercophora newfieldiana TaxID=92897 RepID=A0AA40CVR2_9PEZI|nr:hypothetical protein B0T16DRAFT_490262 [Cercophora newfieldiana]
MEANTWTFSSLFGTCLRRPEMVPTAALSPRRPSPTSSETRRRSRRRPTTMRGGRVRPMTGNSFSSCAGASWTTWRAAASRRTTRGTQPWSVRCAGSMHEAMNPFSRRLIRRIENGATSSNCVTTSGTSTTPCYPFEHLTNEEQTRYTPRMRRHARPPHVPPPSLHRPRHPHHQHHQLMMGTRRRSKGAER